MGFMELAKERYTVRKYADKPLEKEQLDKLLECLLIAPTAKNLQPVRVYVIEGEKNLAKLDELTKCRYGAPHVAMKNTALLSGRQAFANSSNCFANLP